MFKIPDKCEVRVGTLKIGAEVTIADLSFDPDVRTDLPADTVVVRVVEHQEFEIELEDVRSPVEPEVIGRKEDDGEDGE